MSTNRSRFSSSVGSWYDNTQDCKTRTSFYRKDNKTRLSSNIIPHFHNNGSYNYKQAQ